MSKHDWPTEVHEQYIRALDERDALQEQVDLYFGIRDEITEYKSAFGYIAQTLEMNDRPQAVISYARHYANRAWAVLEAIDDRQK